MISNRYKIEGNVVTIYLDRRNGDVFECLIDLDEFDKIVKDFNYKWFPMWFKNAHSFYAVSTTYLGIENGKVNNHIIRMNNYILGYPENKTLDHKNHNTLDNRKENLRIASHSDNSKHRNGKNSNNKSGYRNVCLVKTRWIVQLQINGKNTRLKSFPYSQLEEAGEYAESMRHLYYGEYAGKS